MSQLLPGIVGGSGRDFCWLACLLFTSVAAADEAEKLFELRVAPVLSAKCVACHHTGNAKGGFDLSTRDGMLRGGDGGEGLAPGKPNDSPIFTRSIPRDGRKPEMPEKGEPLTEQEAANLREWIERGAIWPKHLVLREKSKADSSFWSLQPVKEVAPPEASGAPSQWSKHPIDRFVWAKLREKGLHPNPAADPRTLIRRATFDLWGLPPTPNEVVQFEQDCRESRSDNDQVLPDAAVGRLLDRLLKSPHYGERWGRHWLDIAHYADTHGFERDQLRPNAWRYRDYVVQALNRDLRYDVFLQQQIAGDVIAPDDSQAVIATGFLAAGPWDFVGQVETRSDVLKRAARASDLDDIVTQVMTATMGLTINCARCHDHKLDPISQEDYYRLTAVFAGVKRGDRDISPTESQQLARRKEELTNQLAQVRGEIARLEGKGWSLADIVGGGDGRGSGKKGRGIDLRSGRPIDEKLGYHRDLPLNQLKSVKFDEPKEKSQPFVKWVFIPDGRTTVSVDDSFEVKGIPATSGHAWDAIRNGPLNAQVSTKLAGVDYASSDHSILGLHANGGITFDLTRLRNAEAAATAGFQFTAVVGFGSGAGGAGTLADFSVFVDQELKFQKLKMQKDETSKLEIAITADAKTLTLIATDGGDGISHDLLFLGDAQLRLDANESQQSAADKTRLAELQGEATRLEKSLAELPAPGKVFAIVAETAPEVRVLRRGNPEDPQQPVAPGVPSCVNHVATDFGEASMPEGERRRRLAEWITHPQNPLTRRVLVNRLWHHHFGQGLVNTPSDFGYGGDRASHPELLDWLANEVLRSDWSLKKLHKAIMLSATYRQSSAFVPGHAKVDGDNRMLWRQNTRRLDAESLRDAVLLVSGKLNAEMGGPGYRDFNYTEAYAPIYEYVTPDRPDLWRRSIYRFVVRTTPHQFMSTLDCPDPANLTPARVTTTTALQALALSNNEFMLRQAEYLAARVTSEATDPADRIPRAFQLTFQRLPAEQELQAARRLVEQQGLFALCRALLNANEFVYVD
jgi:hypothetical protein